jgi:tripartite-type tricarboxylate transporter receptor subunit TctC
MACLPALAVLPQVKAGKLRVLGVASGKRSSLLPDVPTLKEQGLPDVDAGAWIDVVVPPRHLAQSSSAFSRRSPPCSTTVRS